MNKSAALELAWKWGEEYNRLRLNSFERMKQIEETTNPQIISQLNQEIEALMKNMDVLAGRISALIIAASSPEVKMIDNKEM